MGIPYQLFKVHYLYYASLCESNASQNSEHYVQAFDHWSIDTKQDAWFTVASFDAVFETLDSKPKWIKIFSDNGGHYHNSELMSIVSNWNQWYNIDVRGWYFLEPGDAKTSVDSHHAQVNWNLVEIFYYYFNKNRLTQIITCFSFR